MNTVHGLRRNLSWVLYETVGQKIVFKIFITPVNLNIGMGGSELEKNGSSHEEKPQVLLVIGMFICEGKRSLHAICRQIFVY